MALLSIASNALTDSWEVTKEYTYQPVVASASEMPVEGSKLAQVERISTTWGISSTTLYNLAMSESSLGEARIGDGGKSCGIVHFHKDYYPEENSRCDDDEYILNRAAEMISKGEEHKFTPCNCYSFSTIFVGKLPKMKDIEPVSSFPRVGGLAVFNYNGVKHIAVVTKVTEGGFTVKEANYQPCKTGERFVKFDDKALRGFVSYDVE